MGSDPILTSVKRLLQLPALVRPRPVGRCGADLFFHHARITGGEFSARQLLAGRGDAREIHLVMATRGAPEVREKRRATRGARDFLRADEKRGIAVQEFYPMLALRRLRFLVGEDG